jgi:hypothetical protein
MRRVSLFELLPGMLRQIIVWICYDFHAIHTCLNDSMQSEFYSVPIAFHPAPHHEVR